MCNLVEKYNVPGPRYTSYPTVPYWDLDNFSGRKWKESVRRSFDESNLEEGVSLYIHLPFCESMCTFCGCHKRITKRHDVEIPYIKSVLKEWKMYYQLFGSKPVIKELHLGGGTPTFFSAENLLLLVSGLFENAIKSHHCTMSFEGHPNNTTEQHLKVLYNLGFSKVSFGVQDYNHNVQKAINRVQSFESVQKVTQLAREIGYSSIGHDIIYGLPLQQIEHIKETINRTIELKPDRLAFYSYAHVPWLKGNGQRGFKDSDLPTGELKRAQYKLGKEMLVNAGYVDIGMDHFALTTDDLYESMKNATLHRNFMGYTPSKTQLLIGLGVSSIGDSWYGFAQNVKNLEEYQHLVENNILPIYRGHILTREDRRIRRHTLNLMCRFRTSWDFEEDFPSKTEILERLEEPAKDGLVQINANSIEITEKGKPFVRNICMAFDLLLHRKLPDKRIFSMTI